MSLACLTIGYQSNFFYGELVKGRRSRGASKKCFKDTLKSSLKAFKLDLDSWETLAQDRGKWRSEVHKGAKISEKRHIATAQAKRTARKAKNPSTSRSQLHCHICQRAFAAQIGLTSHMRTHKQTTASWQRPINIPMQITVMTTDGLHRQRWTIYIYP